MDYFELWAAGVSVAEITKMEEEVEQTSIPPEIVEGSIEEEGRRIARKALQEVVKRAQEGDVAAIEWLEKKGILSFSPVYQLGPPVGFAK